MYFTQYSRSFLYGLSFRAQSGDPVKTKYLLRLGAALFLILLLPPLSLLANTQQINIACSSNFYGTLTVLIEAYKKEGHAVNFTVMQGASSKLVAQIMRGMPVDLFLSADEKFPQYLANQKKSEQSFSYAIGQVVLLVNNKKQHHYVSAEDYLEKASITHLSLANPKLAPYGAQAEALLKARKLWEKIVPKMVYGDDVGQAFNYVITNNVDAGFVALSQVKQYEEKQTPAEEKVFFNDRTIYYFDSSLRNIKQDGIVIKNSPNLSEAKSFVEYILNSPKAKYILEKMGYQSPSE
jgi:molybdate transport system substrate-binding protein